MSMISEILSHNGSFVANKEYEPFRAERSSNPKLVVLTCMDARLMELLPRAMNLRPGDAKIIKNAGAIVSHPFGSIMRSILVAIYELGAVEVAVVGHHDCAMTGLNSARILDKARDRGVSDEVLSTLRRAGVDMERWLSGFASVQEGVTQSVEMIRDHPLLPEGIPVHGLIIHPQTGKLELLTDGYARRG
jgi:carbonic anhydrase